MKLTNNLNLPEAIYNAVSNDPYPHGKVGDFSVTQLIESPRIVALRRLHHDEITEDCSDRIWSLLGQLMHELLARADNVADVEERLFTNVKINDHNYVVSGQFDNVTLEPTPFGFHMTDYKLTSVWNVIYESSLTKWEQQLNLLALLSRRNRRSVHFLSITAILRDWSIEKTRREENYPQSQVDSIPIKLWAVNDAIAFLKDRLRLHIDAADNLPLCSDEDRWKDQPVYAVMKKGQKRAKQLFDSLEPALEFASSDNSLYVEKRKSTPRRCELYCNVAPFCDQYQQELTNE